MPDLEDYISGKVGGEPIEKLESPESPESPVELGRRMDKLFEKATEANDGNQCWSNCEPACSCAPGIEALMERAVDLGLLGSGPVEEEPTLDNFKVGDRIVIVDYASAHWNNRPGECFKIDDGFVFIRTEDNGEEGGFFPSSVRKLGENTSDFQVGDRVEVLGHPQKEWNGPGVVESLAKPYVMIKSDKLQQIGGFLPGYVRKLN